MNIVQYIIIVGTFWMPTPNFKFARLYSDSWLSGSDDNDVINHSFLSTIRGVVGSLTCTSMANNSTSDTVAALHNIIIVRWLKCVDNVEIALGYGRSTYYRDYSCYSKSIVITVTIHYSHRQA